MRCLPISQVATGAVPGSYPELREFHLAHPQIDLEFVATTDLARLEHGEAHVAFRAGPKPETLDYVVKLYRNIRFGIYASREYVSAQGMPDIANLAGHTFIGSTDEPSPLPYVRWMRANLGEGVTVFKVFDLHAINAAVKAGIGLGFLADHEATGDPNLVEILAPSEDWAVQIWVVTHVDLHRTDKVQGFLKQI